MNIARITLLAALAVPCVAQADNAEMLQCRQMKDSSQRLACYDAIDVTPYTTNAPAPSNKQGDFGLPAARAIEADSVESTLAAAIDGWRPNDVFQLANGQRWQVADGSSSVMRPKKPNVKVRRGAFGAFYMEFDGINQSPRVKRIE